MSSNDEDHTPRFPGGKRRRIERACDVCRRWKSRCDGSQIPGDKCRTCTDANLDCTYLEGAAKRRPAKTDYVKSLETRLKQAKLLISNLRGEGVPTLLDYSPSHRESPASNSSNSDSGPTADSQDPPTPAGAPMTSLEFLRMSLRSLNGPPPPPDTEDLMHFDLAQNLERLAIGDDEPKQRFIGKSSGADLIQAAIDLREDHSRASGWSYHEAQGPEGKAYTNIGADSSGVQNRTNVNGSNFIGRRADTDNAESGQKKNGAGPSPWSFPWTSRRMQFWTFASWDDTASPSRTVAYSFPPPDLTAHLINLYFTHMNSYFPLLHRPTFERNVESDTHHKDRGFAGIVLMVCAVASRWSDDPRVMMPTNKRVVEQGSLTCGWIWFDQVTLGERHLFGHPTLYDLQYYALAVQFLLGSSRPQGCWTLTGVGIRLAQDIDVHRRTAQHEEPSVERELWKRAFWVLVYMDRTVSSAMGRTCAIQYDEFDLEYPIECDDEYWEHPSQPFRQPAGVPSRVAFFNTLLRLNNILGFCLKILYPLSKVKIMFWSNEDWEEQVVSELDSALNRWRDEIPAHLRWDPARSDPVFFDQSVALHCAYYHLQILIHRPFIPLVNRKSAPTALPSLAICTSGARACANMLDVQRRRKGTVPISINMVPAFTAGLVLLLNVWSAKRTGLMPREIANVKKCMEVVRLCETRWQCAVFAGIFSTDWHLSDGSPSRILARRTRMGTAKTNTSGARGQPLLRYPRTHYTLFPTRLTNTPQNHMNHSRAAGSALLAQGHWALGPWIPAVSGTPRRESPVPSGWTQSSIPRFPWRSRSRIQI
ncbi:fungal-specific transcription factor domain-containing protein [Mycena maculata]|uniref:Fungal-specific transcription factor domain-containing protein n=1 Tax=Mycena maculata TaxID=230809 RepID=A0AAD7K0Q1_9AGAR|nr:fungal-specific transcription factor domain-containing protein [Mycena maculata]